MTPRCVVCGDPALSGGGTLCLFCSLFGVRRTAVPSATIRARVMREIEALHGEVADERAVTRAWRAQARVQRARGNVAVCVAVAALVFGLMMLNALPSASAASGRGLVDLRAERLLQAWCPSSMPRSHCVSWMRVAQCETGDPDDRGVTASSLLRIRWRYDGASGFDGGLQFGVRSWRASVARIPARRLTRAQWVARERGVYRYAHAAPVMVQVLAADALRVRPDGGLGHWPSCGARWRG